MSTKSIGKWETDAGRIVDFDKLGKFVYRNDIVNSFLDDPSKCFIIAAKGMGKTLLLSYKRFLLESDDSRSQLFIPNRHPYLSFVENITTTLSKEHINSLKDWEFCSRLWTFVIELCVISHADIDKKEFIDELPSRAEKHKEFLSDAISKKRSIDYIFNELIARGESTIQKIVNDCSNYVKEKYANLHQGMVIFFDRLDNALELSHDEIWTSIQVGLLEAAWNIMRTNPHTKVYLSIRQEAYASHRSRNSSAISSSVVKINYSPAELRTLVNHLVQYYEKVPTIEEFLGIDTFYNTIVYRDENVFEFMYRYSIGRPRDFVQICGELATKKDSYNTLKEKRKQLKLAVREVSSTSIIPSLFDEVRMLLKTLRTQELFDNFLKLIYSNIFTYDDLQDICKRFNEVNCVGECEMCRSDMHPFCDLYNMGLLGVVEKQPGEETITQKFKSPYEDFIHGLQGKYFLIHPALREYIKSLHNHKDKYRLDLGILVGDGLEWTEEDEKRFYINKWIREMQNPDYKQYCYSMFEQYVKGAPIAIKEENLLANGRVSLVDRKKKEAIKNYVLKGEFNMPKPITAFVSYAYDSPEHQENVISFVDMLLGMGIDATMDVKLKGKYPNIDEMMTYGLSLDKVIIVLSEEYKRKADEGVGGVWKEFQMIAADLEKHPLKYIFVSFDSLTNERSEKISPRRIGCRWIVDLEKGQNDNYSELISFITEKEEYDFRKVNPKSVQPGQKTIKPFGKK